MMEQNASRYQVIGDTLWQSHQMENFMAGDGIRSSTVTSFGNSASIPVFLCWNVTLWRRIMLQPNGIELLNCVDPFFSKIIAFLVQPEASCA
ncbi:uncharacterized protein LOC131239830 isoform X2 [Magnolia sinica]|uniref:uncharacterized protein LOC131239830 isoform X2 n=1 Tax=Magnolia sinica TaxID=86752 RepID=UPI002658F2EA|nr:uncharacterized protein LOC131239830 isoform X2 [Magnolia sinica]